MSASGKKSSPRPWKLYENSRTGRVEVYEEVKGGRRLVGSMPGDPTDDEIEEMMQRLEDDPRCS